MFWEKDLNLLTKKSLRCTERTNKMLHVDIKIVFNKKLMIQNFLTTESMIMKIEIN